MPTNELHNIFGHARLDDRQTSELIGISRGIIADGCVNLAEAQFLETWLVANVGITGNPIIGNLLRRVTAILQDGVLDGDEARELTETLSRFTGGKLELGELLKSTILPLDTPPPELVFDGASYCFTGTFAYGTRKDCEAAVERHGGTACSLTKKTDYLVVGAYATESWAQSVYGRKIERAVEMKAEGLPICIVGEAHWVEYVK
jgi:NAD-dependent DNA ligase